MTDEQIKQNAEEYAEQNKVNFSEDKNFEVYDYFEQKEAYIAGAHSRDEEIEELKNEIAILKIEKYSYANMATLTMRELEKLCNPWISVEERLPEKSRGLYELEEDEQHKHVLFRTRNGLTFSGYLDAEEIWRDEMTMPVNFITPSPVTHWMPIPELKKGGEQ